ncbi:hypothetical protein NQ176_g11133 [Zarea fungicola]|uniref:Uncharacterized protein n=1 Tax=Zarea fungicola TaxID=93591 RepID=A0ACC1MCY9_9HYPO|nr:hypothetical protein NQ176_g11133 [Lecanicillium fungicola]
MCAAKQVGLALGTDAWTTDPEQIKKQEELLQVAKKYGVSILDTARLYAGGASESAIGTMSATKGFDISTKLPGGFAPDGSSAAGVLKYTEQSLDALKLEKPPPPLS